MKKFLNTDFILKKIREKTSHTLSQRKIGEIYGINEATLVKYKRQGLPENISNLLILLCDADIIELENLISTNPYQANDMTEERLKLRR